MIDQNNLGEFSQFRLETSNRLTKIETILESQSTILANILVQTTKTNGRVSQLELWRSSLTGRIIGLSAGISSTIGIIIYLVKEVLTK